MLKRKEEAMQITAYQHQRPFFSIVMCTWNRRRSIVRAIESVLAQTFVDWELIIVDDGSKDNTLELVLPFAQEYANIVYVHHKHRGQALSRNAGLRMASGLFVTFLDSDDYYLPEHLETRYTLLVEYPEVTLLHGGVRILGESSVPDKDDPSKRIAIEDCIVGGTMFVRHDLMERAGGVPAVAYGDDTAWFGVLRQAGATVARTTEPTYVYDRTEEDSLTHLAGKQQAVRPELVYTNTGKLSTNDAFYRSAIYVVEQPRRFVMHIEKACPELEQVLREHEAKTAAYITAFNPNGNIVSWDTNAKQDEKLRHELTTRNYTFLSGYSTDKHDDHPHEISYLVLNISKKEALILAKTYKQEAIVFATVNQ